MYEIIFFILGFCIGALIVTIIALIAINALTKESEELPYNEYDAKDMVLIKR